MKRDIVKLYKGRAGTIDEIAALHGLHTSTVYRILADKGVKLMPIAEARYMYRAARISDQVQPTYPPEALLAEQPAPVEPAPQPKPKKRSKARQKGFWGRILSVFRR